MHWFSLKATSCSQMMANPFSSKYDVSSWIFLGFCIPLTFNETIFIIYEFSISLVEFGFFWAFFSLVLSFRGLRFPWLLLSFSPFSSWLLVYFCFSSSFVYCSPSTVIFSKLTKPSSDRSWVGMTPYPFLFFSFSPGACGCTSTLSLRSLVFRFSSLLRSLFILHSFMVLFPSHPVSLLQLLHFPALLLVGLLLLLKIIFQLFSFFFRSILIALFCSFSFSIPCSTLLSGRPSWTSFT